MPICMDQFVLHLVAMCGYYSQAALRAVGPLTPPAPYSPGQSPGGEGGAKRLDGADVRCEV
jgi:hypothetical protein